MAFCENATTPRRISRPVMQYRGGKWRLSTWVIRHFPPHRCYTEAFGGAASVLLRKDPVECEVYNDLDERVVNVFRVLRDPVMARRLAGLLALTPYSRAEYERAWDDPRSEDLVEDARRTILINQMGFGSAGLMPGQTAATFQSRCVSENPAKPWATYHSHVELFCGRLQNVVIECRPAIDVLKQQDSPETLHYVDPPYVMLARCERPRTSYLHEMTDDDHRELAEVLHSLKGMVVLSGYRSELYDELFSDWPYVTHSALTSALTPREERLWLSPRSVEWTSGLVSRKGVF